MRSNSSNYKKAFVLLLLSFPFLLFAQSESYDKDSLNEKEKVLKKVDARHQAIEREKEVLEKRKGRNYGVVDNGKGKEEEETEAKKKKKKDR